MLSDLGSIKHALSGGLLHLFMYLFILFFLKLFFILYFLIFFKLRFYMICLENSSCPYTQGLHTIDIDYEMCYSAFGITSDQIQAQVLNLMLKKELIFIIIFFQY